MPVHDNVLPVVERVLDPGCLVSSLSSITILPGETAQPIHADDQLIPIPKPHPPTVCNTMWALTDFTDANGATRLVPGSHLGTENPVYGADYDTIPAEMATGSVLVWHGSLWHGGGANRTDDRRVGIAMNYCAGYIRQQENQQLGVPPALARTFPKRLQQLSATASTTGSSATSTSTTRAAAARGRRRAGRHDLGRRVVTQRRAGGLPTRPPGAKPAASRLDARRRTGAGRSPAGRAPTLRRRRRTCAVLTAMRGTRPRTRTMAATGGLFQSSPSSAGTIATSGSRAPGMRSGGSAAAPGHDGRQVVERPPAAATGVAKPRSRRMAALA